MDNHNFTVSDGLVTAEVTGSPKDNRINVTFNVAGEHEPDVIDNDKCEAALHHRRTIDSLMRRTSNIVHVNFTHSETQPVIALSATFEKRENYHNAIGMLREIILQPYTRQAALAVQGEPEEEYKLRPETPPAPANSNEAHNTARFLERIRDAQAKSEVKKSTKEWNLQRGSMDGISIRLFPTDKSDLTGNQQDRETNIIALRITANPTTSNARAEINHHSHEIDKRLRRAGLTLHHSEIYYGSHEDGRSDTSIILVHAGPNPLETLSQVNETLAALQDDYAITQQKMGTRRTNHPRNMTTIRVHQESKDPLIEQITSNIKSAVDSGIIKLDGSADEIKAWIQSMANEIRAQQQRPPRRSNG